MAEKQEQQGQQSRVAALLAESLDERLVSRRPVGWGSGSVAYLTTAAMIRQANRIFGYGAWSTELLMMPTKIGSAYMACMKVTVHFDGREAHYSDVGYCAIRDDTSEAEDAAIKGAVSDALKRCLRHLGAQFGNDLYDKDEAENEKQQTDSGEYVLVTVESVMPSDQEDGPNRIRMRFEDGISQALPCYAAPLPEYVRSGKQVWALILTSKKGNKYIKNFKPAMRTMETRM